jgi:hypothetical protein
MRILFVNTPEPQCGVHQYGENLFAILATSQRHHAGIARPSSLESLRSAASEFGPDLCIYNWSPVIGGWMSAAPFDISKWSLVVYHDGAVDAGRFSGVLNSDCTAPRQGNNFPIGRPIPFWNAEAATTPRDVPWIGVNGFNGAWAQLAVSRILVEFESAVIRLHLPHGKYTDPYRTDETIRQCLAICRNAGVTPELQCEFKPLPDLMKWLQQNDLNCYMRGSGWPGGGVSSVLDCALAVRRPIAVDHSHAFRHVHGLTPSIRVEDSSLKTIMANGTAPLQPLYERHDQKRVLADVEACIDEVTGHNELATAPAGV